jgi:hypothetical protein
MIEDFVPYDGNNVTLYTCGPTVYHFAHIGNLRSYIMEDILEKALKHLGYNVKRAMNITDVGHLSSDGDSGEDKMLIGAKRENKTVLEIAAEYTEAFKKDCERLGLSWPEIVIPATSCIDEYIRIITELLQKAIEFFPVKVVPGPSGILATRGMLISTHPGDPLHRAILIGNQKGNPIHRKRGIVPPAGGRQIQKRLSTFRNSICIYRRCSNGTLYQNCGNFLRGVPPVQCTF